VGSHARRVDTERRVGATERLPVASDAGPALAIDPTTAKPHRRIGRAQVLVAVVAFATMCVAVLAISAQLLEPDDYAYRASIIALTQGHLLSLTNTEYQALLRQLGDGGGQGVAQWVHTASGTWISEKNSGYPFLALPFQAMGLLRVVPLFYGALGCLGLFFGARRWLGRWGGTGAVICSAAREQHWLSPGGPRCPRPPTPR